MFLSSPKDLLRYLELHGIPHLICSPLIINEWIEFANSLLVNKCSILKLAAKILICLDPLAHSSFSWKCYLKLSKSTGIICYQESYWLSGGTFYYNFATWIVSKYRDIISLAIHVQGSSISFAMHLTEPLLLYIYDQCMTITVLQLH